MVSLTIGPGTQVTLNFALMLDDESIVDSNFDSDPVTFAIGDGSLLPGFEQAMFGLCAGQEGVFEISPEKGFGQRNPSNIQNISRGQFPSEMKLESGLMLSFSDAQNNERPGVIESFDDDNVVIDFNHPLAGKNIQFKVRIVDVIPEVMH